MIQGGDEKFPWRWVLGWIGVYLLIEGVLIGIPLISGSSEAREAQVIDVIGRTGEFILPTRNGIIPSKPPLFHWVGWLTSALTGGLSEFSVRLPSLLFSACVLVFASRVAFSLARTLPRILSHGMPSVVARITVVLLALTHGFHIMATQAMVDMTYTFFVWGAIFALVVIPSPEWLIDQRVSRFARGGFFLSLAGATLSRGPLGGALVGYLCFVGGVYLFGFERACKALLKPSFSWIFLALPAAWYLSAYGQGSGAFVERQLLFENLRRVVGGEHINTEAWWFYVPSLFRATFPWGILALYLGISESRRVTGTPSRGGMRGVLLPGIVLVAGVVLISFSSGKRHSYLLPFFPLVALQCALLVGVVLSRVDFVALQSSAKRARQMEVVLGLLSVLLCLVGLGFVYGGAHLSPHLALVRSGLLQAAPWACGILACVALPVALGERRLGISLRNAALSLLGILASVTCAGNTIKGASRDFSSMAAQWISVADSGEQLAVIKDTFDEYFDPILFYVRREVQVLPGGAARLQCAPNVVYLAHREWMTAARHVFQGRIQEILSIREQKAAVGKNAPVVVAFRCATESAPAEAPPLSSEPLRDA